MRARLPMDAVPPASLTAFATWWRSASTGLCCGREDICDHNVLRRDLALQAAVGRTDELASAPPLSRLQSAATSEHAVALHGALIEQSIVA